MVTNIFALRSKLQKKISFVVAEMGLKKSTRFKKVTFSSLSVKSKIIPHSVLIPHGRAWGGLSVSELFLVKSSERNFDKKTNTKADIWP